MKLHQWTGPLLSMLASSIMCAILSLNQTSHIDTDSTTQQAGKQLDFTEMQLTQESQIELQEVEQVTIKIEEFVGKINIRKANCNNKKLRLPMGKNDSSLAQQNVI